MALAFLELSAAHLRKIGAVRMRRSFATYVQRAWPHIDPAPLIWNWHLDAVCAALQAVSEGEISDLVINIPPGLAKSVITSVLWPTWQWAREPDWQVLVGSYEVGLSTRDAVKSRTLMKSKWWIEHFRPSWEFSEDQDAKTYYSNTAGGHRASLGVGGKGTGYRGRALIIDDPLNVKDSYSKVARDTAIKWITETMASRANDPAKFQRVMIAQRLHEEDPSGYVLKQGGWQHLNLPAVLDQPDKRSQLVGKSGRVLWTDTRQRGELLFPARYPEAVLAKLKSGKGVGSTAYEAQYQQRPVPAAGNLIKREWFRNRFLRPGEAPVEGFNCKLLPVAQFDCVEIYTDAAFKKTDESDKVAIGVVARAGPDLYLLDLRWDRMSFTETLEAILDLRRIWRKVSMIRVEDKANGSAIIDVLKQKISGVVEIQPEGGKESRIAAAAPSLEAANVWFPANPAYDLQGLIDEAAAFPKGANDDAIDMLSYAINTLITNSELQHLEEMAKGA